MLSNWICLVCVVFSFFLNSTTCSCTRYICDFCSRHIVLGPVPLKNLYRTCFNTSAISDTRVPVDCDHRAMYAQRDNFFSSRCIGRLYLLIFGRLSFFSWTPNKVIMLTIRMHVLTYYLVISRKVWIYWHIYLTLIK